MAEKTRRIAKGEADAIFLKKEAEARGQQEILTRQAAGLAEIVRAAGGDPKDALRLLLADKMEDLIAIQVEAIKNIKIDKVTVWDAGQGAGQDGKNGTAGFLSGLMKSIPPMNELFNMAGMNLPEFLGKDISPEVSQKLMETYDQKMIEAAEEADQNSDS
jgi:flotillin